MEFDELEKSLQSSSTEANSGPGDPSYEALLKDLGPAPSNNQSTSPSSGGGGFTGLSGTGDQGAIMAGIESFNRVFSSVAEGTLDLVGKAVGSQTLQSKVKQTHDALQASAELASSQHPTASAIGTGVGIIASTAIPMGGVTGSLANRVLVNAGAGAGLGFINYAGSIEDRVNNAAVSGLIGGAVPVAMTGYGQALRPIGQKLGLIANDSAVQGSSGMISQAMNPAKAVANDVGAELDNAGMLNQAMANKQKFDNVNIPAYVTDVAQDALDPSLKSIKMTPERRGEIRQKISAQDSATKAALQKQMNEFVPNGVEADTAIKNKMYQDLNNKLVPDDVVDDLTKKPEIAKRLYDLNKDVDTGMSELADGSLGKMEAVRKRLAKDAYSPDTDPTAAAHLKGVLKDFTTKLDNIDPSYKATRQAGDRISMYNEFKEALETAAPKGGSGNTLDVGQMYTRLFGDGVKQKTFLDAVRRSGGNVQNSKDLIDVMNLLKDGKLKKLANKTDSEVSTGAMKGGLMGAVTGGIVGGPSGALAGAALGVIKSLGEFMTKTKYQDAFLKLNFSPKWQSELTNVLTKKAQAKYLGISDLIRKVANSSKAASDIRDKVKAGAVPMLAPALSQDPNQ